MKKVCAAIVAALSFVFISCATKIPVTVTRPSKLDVGSAKTISVVPFNVTNDMPFWFEALTGVYEADQTDVAEYLTSSLNEKLSVSDYYTLLDVPREDYNIKNKIKADIYITGKIVSFSSYVNSHTEKIEEKSNHSSNDKDANFLTEKKYKYIDKYQRTFSSSIEYRIVESKTKRILLSNIKQISASSGEYESHSSVPSTLSLIRNNLDSITKEILQSVQPYKERFKLELLEDKTKNPDLKRAKELAKDGNLDASKELYLSVYESTDDFAAGYNASVLMIASGNLQSAKTLMEKLFTTSNDERAAKTLNKIKYEIAERRRLENQQKEKNSTEDYSTEK